MNRENKDHIALLDSLIGLTEVRVLQGELNQARKLLGEACADAAKPTKRTVVELSWIEAWIDFASGSFAEAEVAASAAARDAGAAGFVDEHAEAEALRARALIEAGKLAPAREAVTRGQALLATTTSNVARTELAVADGLLLAKEDPRHPARAEQALEAAVAIATSKGVSIDRWEARLALAVVRARGKSDAARADLRELAQQASAQGFGLYARYAEAALARR
jgi:hypothetical protein